MLHICGDTVPLTLVTTNVMLVVHLWLRAGPEVPWSLVVWEELIHWLNFERPNFQQPNFGRLNFKWPNFERLNFEKDSILKRTQLQTTQLRLTELRNEPNLECDST